MKPWLIGSAVCCAALAAALLWWRNEAGPAVSPAEVAAPEAVATAERSVQVPPEPIAPPAAVAALAPQAPAEVAPAGEISRPEQWTVETLSGTTWKGDSFDFSFAKDGTWYMAGRAASKWRVEGSRIKLFDGKGEVRYLEIEGDEILFNGEPIGHPVSRD